MISIVLEPSKGLLLLYNILWGGAFGLNCVVFSQVNMAYANITLALLALIILLTWPYYVRRYVSYRHPQAIVKIELNLATHDWVLTTQNGQMFCCQLEAQSIAIRLGALLLFKAQNKREHFFVPLLPSQCSKAHYCQLLRWWHGYEN